jgi:hypothetical protein
MKLFLLCITISFSALTQVTYSKDINSRIIRPLFELGSVNFKNQDKYNSLDFNVSTYSYYLDDDLRNSALAHADLLDKKSCWGYNCESISNNSFADINQSINNFCESMKDEVDDHVKVQEICMDIYRVLKNYKSYGYYKVNIIETNYSNHEDYEVGIILTFHDHEDRSGELVKVSYLKKM